MSYGISVVAIKQPDNRYRFGFIGGFDGMNWHLSKDKPRHIQRLNNSCKAHIYKLEDNYTSEELLKTAPLDEVILITGESSYESMKKRKPIDISKNLSYDVDKHLTLKS